MTQHKPKPAHKSPRVETPQPEPNTTPTQQLIADLNAAREGDEGTLDYMWPAKIYNRDVVVNGPNESKTMCMPKFCLTDFAATELIAALATRSLQCEVKAGPPAAGDLKLSGDFSFSASVPWLTVTIDDAPYSFNAGEVYDYVAHGRTPKDALNLAEWDIRQQAFLQGLGPAPDPLVIMAQTAG